MTYPRLTSIPRPLDYVITSIPTQSLLPFFNDCIAKVVRVVQIFAAGFSETGKDKGHDLEKDMAKKQKRMTFELLKQILLGYTLLLIVCHSDLCISRQMQIRLDSSLIVV
ncbi:MAG: hypothetical protein SWO11_18335 [Thermodesulfobacteriota bacterium]|nr:hypothetical protein [Thermodesulfobacteriota bacterium]